MDRLFEALRSKGIIPLMIVGVSTEGVFKLISYPQLRHFLSDPAKRERLVAEFKSALERLGTTPMDDLELI